MHVPSAVPPQPLLYCPVPQSSSQREHVPGLVLPHADERNCPLAQEVHDWQLRLAVWQYCDAVQAAQGQSLQELQFWFDQESPSQSTNASPDLVQCR